MQDNGPIRHVRKIGVKIMTKRQPGISISSPNIIDSGNWIDSSGMKGVASKDPLERQNGSLHNPVPGNSLHSITGTCGIKPA